MTKSFHTRAERQWEAALGQREPLCWGPGRGGGAGVLWGGADLSEAVLLGVLQSEFMEAIEMMDNCR